MKNMYRMFYRAESFNQPLNDWNVSNVESMCEMFKYAVSHSDSDFFHLIRKF